MSNSFLSKDQPDRLSKTSRVLHWLIALGMVALLCVGIIMTKNELWNLYDLHKSIGLLLSVLIIFRVIWRAVNGWPHPAGHYRPVEKFLGKITHWGLIVGSVLIPVFGMMHSGFSGHGFGIFGMEIVKENPDPQRVNEVLPIWEAGYKFGQAGHQYISYLLICLLVLHIAGALKHHIVDKDKTLLRMLGK